MEKTNIGRAINPHRVTDVEYIQYLEETITIMHARVDTFIHSMDKTVFEQGPLAKTYVNNLYLLRLPKE